MKLTVDAESVLSNLFQVRKLVENRQVDTVSVSKSSGIGSVVLHSHLPVGVFQNDRLPIVSGWRECCTQDSFTLFEQLCGKNIPLHEFSDD